MKYAKLVALYDKLDGTTKRLEKTFHIAQFLTETQAEDMPLVVPLLQGRIFPAWDERKIGVASRLMIKAISVSTGATGDRIEQEWKKTGDLGTVAENLVAKKKQATLFRQDLTIQKVSENIKKLADLTGPGTVDKKVQLISQLLTSAQPREARYLARTILEELRAGVGDGAIRDAIVWSSFPPVKRVFTRCACGSWMPAGARCLACGQPMEKVAGAGSSARVLPAASTEDLIKADLTKVEAIESSDDAAARVLYNYLVSAVQSAYDLTNDFSRVAQIAREKGLKGLLDMALQPGTPIKVMLALKVKDVAEGIERVGTPLDAEYKLDGFRLQIHKRKDGKVQLFTRRLDEVTAQFPEVVRYTQDKVKGSSFILDAEAVGFNPRTKQYMPFQHISQRIKRKYHIDRLQKELPVEVNVFDVLYYEGKNLITSPFRDRRALIENIVAHSPQHIVVIKNVVTDRKEVISKFYQESVALGNEGIMLKKLDAPYKPGARVGYMVKLKSSMETLDLVIVGAEWGEGKRANWLTSFTLACVDEDNAFLEIGKVGTGIKELEGEGVTFQQLTEILRPLITYEKGREVKVKPEVVVEVQYEEIQKSPTYSSGYALRFPRVVRLRTMEKSAKDATVLEYIEDLYQGQTI